MIKFIEFIKEFRQKVDPIVRHQRKINKLNADISSGEPGAQQEKQQYLRDLQNKKRDDMMRKQQSFQQRTQRK